tara:strand:+ start:3333 stop:4352 length:1020 start_codon:yes stop_codon:yes gene_type:complete
MPLLIHGDCLEEMKQIDDDSVDFIFCDLPYGQTSCKWDCKIDLDKFWIEIMRIKKLRTPIFMTTTTKFGVELITSAPKKCPFRYDLVWVKSAPAGFLSAKKMPMRKHELVYVFYEKLPFYDLSSHKHKFLKEEQQINNYKAKRVIYKDENGNVIKEGQSGKNQTKYDPPLPVSVVKEVEHKWVKSKKDIYGEAPREDNKECGGHQKRYDPPLPVSVVKEPEPEPQEIDNNNIYRGGKGKPLVLHDYDKKGRKGSESAYEPPLPNSILEVKTTRGKHSTEKPVALIEWLLKYFSKEGDVVLDPTMGSGSTGVACKNLNREFIGIELDDDIFEGAISRLGL